MLHRLLLLLAALLLGAGCAGELQDPDGGTVVDQEVGDAAGDGVAESGAVDQSPETYPPQELGIYDGGGTTPCHTNTCKTATEVCVRTYTGSSFSYKCKTVPSQCLGMRTCACLGSTVCVAPYSSCAEGPAGSNLVVCQ